MLNKNDKIALVCCSNGQRISNKNKLEKLNETMKEIGLEPVWGKYIYGNKNGINGSAEDKATELMEFYNDNDIKAIFDISGGDIANEILPSLDFEVIKNSNKLFYGYSDLTTIINAIYKKTGNESVLYQIRNLIYSDSENQIQNFTNSVLLNKNDLFHINYDFIQKSDMEGVVVGGNIRCLLKLAGTEFWPDMQDKILLLESYGGEVPQMITYLSQLKQMNVFNQIKGILLGTFTILEDKKIVPTIQELLKIFAGDDLPIAYTKEIGHSIYSKGIIIGRKYHFKSVTVSSSKII